MLGPATVIGPVPACGLVPGAGKAPAWTRVRAGPGAWPGCGSPLWSGEGCHFSTPARKTAGARGWCAHANPALAGIGPQPVLRSRELCSRHCGILAPWPFIFPMPHVALPSQIISFAANIDIINWSNERKLFSKANSTELSCPAAHGHRCGLPGFDEFFFPVPLWFWAILLDSLASCRCGYKLFSSLFLEANGGLP